MIAASLSIEHVTAIKRIEPGNNAGFSYSTQYSGQNQTSSTELH